MAAAGRTGTGQDSMAARGTSLAAKATNLAPGGMGLATGAGRVGEGCASQETRAIGQGCVRIRNHGVGGTANGRRGWCR